MATLWRYSQDERAAFENGYRAAIQDVLVMESASARRTPEMLPHQAIGGSIANP